MENGFLGHHVLSRMHHAYGSFNGDVIPPVSCIVKIKIEHWHHHQFVASSVHYQHTVKQNETFETTHSMVHPRCATHPLYISVKWTSIMVLLIYIYL